jgi:hypothetical protein
MLSHVSEEAKAEYQIGAEAVEKLEEAVAEEASSVLVYYAHVRGKLLNRFDAAAQTGDAPTMDRMAARIHENLYHTARVTGELARSPLLVKETTNIIGGTDNARLIAAIVEAVAPYQDARIAVTSALRRLEAPAIEDHSGGE